MSAHPSVGFELLCAERAGNQRRVGEGCHEQMPGGLCVLSDPRTGFQGDPGAEENPYYTWVDQHHIPGLGANVPIAVVSPVDRSSIFPKSTPSRRLD